VWLRAQPTRIVEKKGAGVCTSQQWGLIRRSLCSRCMGWMREGVRCLARNRSEIYDSVSMGVSLWFWQFHSSGLPDSGRSWTSALGRIPTVAKRPSAEVRPRSHCHKAVLCPDALTPRITCRRKQAKLAVAGQMHAVVMRHSV